MSIKVKGKKGTYWCDFYTSEGKRIRKSLHTTDTKEAKKGEAKLKLEARLGVESVNLSEAFQHALRVRDEWRSAKQLDAIKAIYKSVENHFGAKCKLSQTTPGHVLAGTCTDPQCL